MRTPSSGPGAVCYPDVQVGSRVVLKGGAVIGGPGSGIFPARRAITGFPTLAAVSWRTRWRSAPTRCVDRGSVDDTVIGAGTKIDNLVHVGHNVRIGRRCLLMAGVGVAGSTHMGDDVILAGHVGVTDHLVIGDRARIAAKSAVFGDIPAGASFSGHPARPHRQFLRAQAALYRVAPIISDLERLVPRTSRDDDSPLPARPSSAVSASTPAAR